MGLPQGRTHVPSLGAAVTPRRLPAHRARGLAPHVLSVPLYPPPCGPGVSPALSLWIPPAIRSLTFFSDPSLKRVTGAPCSRPLVFTHQSSLVRLY